MGKKSKNKKRGPKPNHSKIDEEGWENAAKRTIQKKKPKDGWPKRSK